MPELPHLSGIEVIKLLRQLGFSVVRQKGSHAVLRCGGRGCVVPLHKEVAIGTLRGALKQAGIAIDDFVNVYKKGK